MNKRPARPVKDELSLIWEVLKSIVFFLGIYLFFLGWLYLYFYFNEFKIPFDQIDVDATSFYSYGFLSLVNFKMELIFFLFFILMFLIYYHRSTLKYHYALILSLILIFFFSSYFVVKSEAEESASKILNNGGDMPHIVMDFSDAFLKSVVKDSMGRTLAGDSVLLTESGNKSVRLLHFNNQYKLLKIFENSDSYYVLYNPKKPGVSKYQIEIYCVNKKDLNYAEDIIPFK
jgi:hypothetical protein